MFETEKVGRNNVAFCTNISCWLNGAEDLVAHAEKKLGCKLGESTADGRVFLKREEECLAACCGAPMMVINGHYHEKLDAREGRRAAGRAEVRRMAQHRTTSEGYGPVGPAPKEHSVVYTTLHFDKPWSYENYLKTGGYSALRKILDREDRAGRRHRDGQAVRPARPRRRGLPDRPEVELHAQGRRHAEVHPVQLRRIRAGHLPRTATSCATTRMR